LQPELLRMLNSGASEAAAYHALAALQSMSALGVLHPNSALPAILAASLAGLQSVSGAARRLVLRLVEASPPLLERRLIAGVREAAEMLVSRDALGRLAGDAWRFAAVREAFAEHLETRAAREHLIDLILQEVSNAACPKNGAIVPASVSTDGNAAALLAAGLQRQLVHLELLFGILSSLPLRGDAELSRLIFGAAQFIALRAAPLLPDGESDQPEAAEECDVSLQSCIGICAASVLLHQLCEHWAAGDQQELRRLLAVAAESSAPTAVRADAGQLSSQTVGRRPAPDLTALFTELMNAAASVFEESGGSTSVGGLTGRTHRHLQALLVKYIPQDSCLLRGAKGMHMAGVTAEAKRRKRAKPDGPAQAHRASGPPTKRPRKAKAAASTAAATAGA